MKVKLFQLVPLLDMSILHSLGLQNTADRCKCQDTEGPLDHALSEVVCAG